MMISHFATMGTRDESDVKCREERLDLSLPLMIRNIDGIEFLDSEV